VLTNLTIRNFKLFEEVELALDERVVLVGPNNSGKTSVLQALALWEVGVGRWCEKRANGEAPDDSSDVVIGRRDLFPAPVPETKHLWRDLIVSHGVRNGERNCANNVLIEVLVEGAEASAWRCGMEFDYANDESYYCRPMKQESGGRMGVPPDASKVRVAYLAPMSGIASDEFLLTRAAVNVHIGEGKTADVLRNICYHVWEGTDGEEKWGRIAERMEQLFGCKLEYPEYIPGRGEIRMKYRTPKGTTLDISASGRGQQQMLLLLAHMEANRGAVLLLDEPDAHLEILRQRATHRMLGEIAEETRSQIIVASHSEAVLTEALGRDAVLSLVGSPRVVKDRGSQVLKSLKDIGFEHYQQAMQKGWILFLEGPTDLAILRQFAILLGHEAQEDLRSPYVHYVSNQPSKAHSHFFGLREAVPDLKGIALFDRLDSPPGERHGIEQLMWRRREIENYLYSKDALMSFAESEGKTKRDTSLAKLWRGAMEQAVSEVEGALTIIYGTADRWRSERKVSEDLLAPILDKFYTRLGMPNQLRKANFHKLVTHLSPDDVHPEVSEKLDAILAVSKAARPG